MRRLRRARAFLIFSLLIFGSVAGLTLALLAPAGSIRARHDPRPVRAQLAGPEWPAVEGIAADRRGGSCALRFPDGELRALPECRSYVAPAVAPLGAGAVVIWERADREIALTELDGRRLGRTVSLPRPVQGQALLTRTSVGSDGHHLAVWYRDRLVTVGPDLTPWPGGATEVIEARMGPRVWVVLLGTAALLIFYFVAASWRLAQPSLLRWAIGQGRCVQAELPAFGTSAVIDGRPTELDLADAQIFGAPLEALAGGPVTLVIDRATHGQGYRALTRLPIAQVWQGDLANAMALARAGRATTVATAVLVTTALLLGLDAYLAL